MGLPQIGQAARGTGDQRNQRGVARGLEGLGTRVPDRLVDDTVAIEKHCLPHLAAVAFVTSPSHLFSWIIRAGWQTIPCHTTA